MIVVTITGPPGFGKFDIATKISEMLAERFFNVCMSNDAKQLKLGKIITIEAKEPKSRRKLLSIAMNEAFGDDNDE